MKVSVSNDISKNNDQSLEMYITHETIFLGLESVCSNDLIRVNRITKKSFIGQV